MKTKQLITSKRIFFECVFLLLLVSPEASAMARVGTGYFSYFIIGIIVFLCFFIIHKAFNWFEKYETKKREKKNIKK